jgi:hypothetical protein
MFNAGHSCPGLGRLSYNVTAVVIIGTGKTSHLRNFFEKERLSKVTRAYHN